MDINVPEHTMFTCGYMDAFGRAYSTEKCLYTLSSSLIPDDSSLEEQLNAKIVGSSRVQNISEQFEKSLSKILNKDPREKLLYYLVEYIQWFSEYTKECKCIQYELRGESIPKLHLCYVLTINHQYDVLIYVTKSNTAEKNA